MKSKSQIQIKNLNQIKEQNKELKQKIISDNILQKEKEREKESISASVAIENLTKIQQEDLQNHTQCTGDYPICSCMKCIIRRERSQRKGNYQFSSLGTNYMKEFKEKKMITSPKYFNRSNRNCFDGTFKQHLSSGLMSTMKFDFKPFKVKLDEDNSNKRNLKSFPFWGNSSYNSTYANYGSASNGNDPKQNLPFIKIPFRGNSNYIENFKKYKDDVYSNRDPSLPINCSLGFKGFMSPQSVKSEQFPPADFNTQGHYFSPERTYKAVKEKSNIIPAKYHNADSTTYENFFNDKNKNCELESYLQTKGMGFMKL